MRQIALAGLGLLALLATGCAHHSVSRGGETITYTAGACLGRCPVYSVTLGPDGQGIFSGERFVGQIGDYRFQASPDMVHRYTRALARLRPKSDRVIAPGERDCGPAATDQPTIDVVWQAAERPPVRLHVYTGCTSREARHLASALRGLPMTDLPLQNMLGSD